MLRAMGASSAAPLSLRALTYSPTRPRILPRGEGKEQPPQWPARLRYFSSFSSHCFLPRASHGQTTEPSKSAPQTPSKSSVPTRQNFALTLLKQAEAQSSTMEPFSRAFALLEVGQAWQGTDRRHAIKLLERAYATTSLIEAHTEGEALRTQDLQIRILRSLATIAPDSVNARLSRLAPPVRAESVRMLLDFCRSHGLMHHAVEVLESIAAESEMPYSVAANLMEMVEPSQIELSRSLFAAALSSYAHHEHSSMKDEFAEMLLRTHDQLPATLVRNAIDELFDQAKNADESAQDPDDKGWIAISSAQGSMQFRSRYDYRAFQLLPVLRTVDPEAAEQIEKDGSDLLALRKNNPDALSRGGTSSPTIRIESIGANTSSCCKPELGFAPNVNAVQMMNHILEDSAVHPNDALANVPLIPDPTIRANTYVEIARANLRKSAAVARTALAGAMQTAPDVPLLLRLTVVRNVALLYFDLGDRESAQQTIEKGLDVSSAMYKVDADSDDPNVAPKPNWPSTFDFRCMLRLAAKISPEWGLGLLKDIPDDDLRLLALVAEAKTLLGSDTDSQLVLALHKGKGEGLELKE